MPSSIGLEQATTAVSISLTASKLVHSLLEYLVYPVPYPWTQLALGLFRLLTLARSNSLFLIN